MTFVFVTFSPTVYGGGSGELGLIPHIPTYVQPDSVRYGLIFMFIWTFVFVTFSPTVYGGGSGGLGLIPHIPTYVQYGIFT